MSWIASWSGGKDGCHACWQAMRDGLDVSGLVNFTAEESGRVRFHGTEAALVGLQAEAAGLALHQKATAPDDYEPAFKAAVAELAERGAEGMVFGDIYVQEHRDWVERVCAEIGIEAREPLWGRAPEEVYLGFLDAGFRAVVVCAEARFVGREWIGRALDREFLAYLKERGVDPCGERGEYHTVATAGPLFKNGRIEIAEGRVVERGGYLFLDTVGYGLSGGTGAPSAAGPGAERRRMD